WRHRAALGGIVSMGAGISLQFLTGRIRRAPPWMRRAGLEWLHRLNQEPRRLFPRYLRDTAFPGLILAQLLNEGRQPDRHRPEPGGRLAWLFPPRAAAHPTLGPQDEPDPGPRRAMRTDVSSASGLKQRSDE